MEKEFEKHQRTIFLAEKNEILFGNKFAKVDFVVNQKKRTIVALVKEFNTKNILSKGIAKCMPGDVFHADIGKAIALAKALEIDIPQEFLQAVQPTEVVKGMILLWSNGRKYRIDKADVSKKRYGLMNLSTGESFSYVHYENILTTSVIHDDTNAQYEEAS
ncbi:hypothetical protein ACFQ38_02550 [Sporosarcina contaminans]|uniref:Uncharacterized protein n=1 Tax=Sporosarcina contaminans TaxID=633403 RepID=A0ABW3TUT5_9BACL